MLTVWKSVGLHRIQESMDHVEQNPYRSRFVMGQRLVNSRWHIAEIQLSWGWESPRLRLLLEFAGCQPQQQQEEGSRLPHRVQTKHRPGVKLELNSQWSRKLDGDCPESWLLSEWWERESKYKVFRSFLSPASHRATCSEHRSPRFGALRRTQIGRSSPTSPVFDAFGWARLSLPLRHLCSTGMRCVTGAGDGARRRLHREDGSRGRCSSCRGEEVES